MGVRSLARVPTAPGVRGISVSLWPSNHQLRLHRGDAGKWLSRCASLKGCPTVLRTMAARRQAVSEARGSQS